LSRGIFSGCKSPSRVSLRTNAKREGGVRRGVWYSSSLAQGVYGRVRSHERLVRVAGSRRMVLEYEWISRFSRSAGHHPSAHPLSYPLYIPPHHTMFPSPHHLYYIPSRCRSAPTAHTTPLAEVPLRQTNQPPLADVAPLRQLANIQPRRNPKRSLQLPRQTFLRQPRKNSYNLRSGRGV